MLMTLLKWITGAAFLGSLFWCSDRACVVLLLAIWTVAIGVLVYSDLADRFLWIPVLLALAGVFSSILPLAISPNVAVVANEAILILFIVSLEVLTKRRRSSIAFMRPSRLMKASP